MDLPTDLPIYGDGFSPNAEGLYPTGYCTGHGKMQMTRPKPEWAEKGDRIRYKGAGGWSYERKAFEECTNAQVGTEFVVAALKIRPSYTDYRIEGLGDRWFNTCMFERI